MSENFYRSMTDRPELRSLEDFDIDIYCANGQEVPYSGDIELGVKVPSLSDEEVVALILIIPQTEYNQRVPVIIGTNLIREFSKLSKEKEADTFPNEWKESFDVLSETTIGKVKVTKKITLLPRETKTVTGFIRKQRNVESAVTECLDDINSTSAVVCPRVVSLKNPGRTSRVPVRRLCNISAKTMHITEKIYICELQEVTVLRSMPIIDNRSILSDISETSKSSSSPPTNLCHQSESEKDNKAMSDKEFNKTFGVNLENVNLSEEQKIKVQKLFQKWNGIFPKSSTDLGHTSAVKHKIELLDEKPFKEPYRHIPPAIFNEVKEHLHEVLKVGAIRKSNSPWSSNFLSVYTINPTCFLLHTRNPQTCTVLESRCRKINQRTKRDAYALPRIEDTLNCLAGSKYFSKLDLKSGYWQVELDERDKEKTAYQAGILRVFPYNDRLDTVFERLAQYNLKVNPKKCEFFKKKITYLGHIVSEDGIQADPVKVEAVKYWHIPKNVKDVRKFLGFAGYYRRFIKGFASIARPLNNFLIGKPVNRKKTSKLSKSTNTVHFKWEKEQQESFDLKRNLSTRLYLHMPATICRSRCTRMLHLLVLEPSSINAKMEKTGSLLLRVGVSSLCGKELSGSQVGISRPKVGGVREIPRLPIWGEVRACDG
ncbi:uncharacterized protein LOC128552836 [Mercenaria mercenaria]|uniref:uncharacterized protein LOC128552836 n=1 Tax=Mercenaria mercenaria TaxID=6596 RepID=UPI00234F67A9|nr:uncharacterized protein LOC128552836 [Mercenaria mercenaria]